MDFFKQAPARAATSRDLFLEGKGISGRGCEDAAGFVVQAGTLAVKVKAPSIPDRLSCLRRGLIGQGVLKDDGTVYRLTQDYPFSSPSAAAGVLLGRSTSGRKVWNDAGRRALKEIQETAIETTTS